MKVNILPAGKQTNTNRITKWEWHENETKHDFISSGSSSTEYSSSLDGASHEKGIVGWDRKHIQKETGVQKIKLEDNRVESEKCLDSTTLQKNVEDINLSGHANYYYYGIARDVNSKVRVDEKMGT